MRFLIAILCTFGFSCLSGTATAGKWSCSTQTLTTDFTLTGAHLAAPAGTSLGIQSSGADVCYGGDLPQGSPVPIYDQTVGVVGPDGYQPITPGLSVRPTITRTSREGEHWDYDGGQTENTGSLGGSWPSVNWWHKPDRVQYFYFDLTYEFRREPGPLAAGYYAKTIGQVITPQGTADLQVLAIVPAATCVVTTKQLNVKLAPAGISDINALNVGETFSPGTHFKIELNCNAAKTLSLTLTDPHASGASPYFQLSPASTAEGVALAVENAASGAKVSPGRTIHIPVDIGDTRIAPEFTVKYVKAPERVKAGKVSATANFTIDYE